MKNNDYKIKLYNGSTVELTEGEEITILGRGEDVEFYHEGESYTDFLTDFKIVVPVTKDLIDKISSYKSYENFEELAFSLEDFDLEEY